LETTNFVKARDSILARVREALRGSGSGSSFAKATKDEHLSESETPLADGSGDVRVFLPKVPDDFAGRVDLFAERSESLRTEFLSCADEAAASAQLKLLSDREGWESIAFPADSGIRALLANVSIGKLEVSRSTSKTDLEKVSAGITGCDALIAQTGSVLLTARSGGGRALSVLPGHHVVIAAASQLVPDLPAAFELLERKYAPNFPSFMTFITGPSRTGDIERVLVLGAHGPRKLTVIVVGGQADSPEARPPEPIADSQ
jgi:L-lactate dehydrogenase complex protein LldG